MEKLFATLCRNSSNFAGIIRRNQENPRAGEINQYYCSITRAMRHPRHDYSRITTHRSYRICTSYLFFHTFYLALHSPPFPVVIVAVFLICRDVPFSASHRRAFSIRASRCDTTAREFIKRTESISIPITGSTPSSRPPRICDSVIEYCARSSRTAVTAAGRALITATQPILARYVGDLDSGLALPNRDSYHIPGIPQPPFRAFSPFIKRNDAMLRIRRVGRLRPTILDIASVCARTQHIRTYTRSFSLPPSPPTLANRPRIYGAIPLSP